MKTITPETVLTQTWGDGTKTTITPHLGDFFNVGWKVVVNGEVSYVTLSITNTSDGGPSLVLHQGPTGDPGFDDALDEIDLAQTIAGLSPDTDSTEGRTQ